MTLLYPGGIVGDYGLKFMDRTEPAYGYRALVVPPRRSFVKIKELFRSDIERPMKTVIHVDLSDEAIVAQEIAEYVVTDNIREHLEELADVYADTARNPSESTNVWVSGFFGSGKSSVREGRRLRACQSR